MTKQEITFWAHAFCPQDHEVIVKVTLDAEVEGEGVLRIPTGEKAYFVPDVECNVCGAKLKSIISARKKRNKKKEKVEAQEYRLRQWESLKGLNDREYRIVARLLVIINGMYEGDEGFADGKWIMREGLSRLFYDDGVEAVLDCFIFPEEPRYRT